MAFQDEPEILDIGFTVEEDRMAGKSLWVLGINYVAPEVQ